MFCLLVIARESALREWRSPPGNVAEDGWELVPDRRQRCAAWIG